MNIRHVADVSIISLFGAWLVATALCQHPESGLDRVRQLDNKLGNSLLPNWRFFAPNPAVEDVHLMYRFANEDKSEHSPWETCHTISPRRWYQAFWFPRRRFEKAVFDAHQSVMVGTAALVSNPESSDETLKKAVEATQEMLNSYVRSVTSPDERWTWQQLMMVRFAGNDPDAQPAYDAIFSYAPIHEGKSS